MSSFGPGTGICGISFNHSPFNRALIPFVILLNYKNKIKMLSLHLLDLADFFFIWGKKILE